MRLRAAWVSMSAMTPLREAGSPRRARGEGGHQGLMHQEGGGVQVGRQAFGVTQKVRAQGYKLVFSQGCDGILFRLLMMQAWEVRLSAGPPLRWVGRSRLRHGC